MGGLGADMKPKPRGPRYRNLTARGGTIDYQRWHRRALRDQERRQKRRA